MRSPIFVRSFLTTNQTMVIKRSQDEFPSMLLRLIVVSATVLALRKRRKKIGWRGKTRARTRISMHEIYNELGPAYFKRAYRMSYETFCKLSNKLHAAIANFARKPGSSPLFSRRGPNGLITPSVRLGCALRYFAGGSPYDIMTSMGIGRADISRSVWFVVDAINQRADMDIIYPKDHDAQQQIAKEFQAKSKADFDCCAGAVDGILIWTNRPTALDAEATEVGPAKYFCGRKHKFGLNCQAICDARGRFLDVSVIAPGATSDVLAFEGAAIYRKLKDGLLAPGTY
jgi:DDE superfamily endonuclease